MRAQSVFTATCHRCGAAIESESPVVKCRCGLTIITEWPAVKEIGPEVAK